MTTDLDPRLEDAARRRLTRLLDAIDVGPAPVTPRATADPARSIDPSGPFDPFDPIDPSGPIDPFGASAPGVPSEPGDATVAAGAARHPTVLDLGTFPARRRAPLRRRAVVGVAAAVAFVLGVAAAVALQPDGGGTPPGREPDTSVDAGDVPRLVPDRLPEGIEPFEAAELPLPADRLDYGRTDVTVYADTAGTLDLGVIVVADETVGMGGTETTVRGGPGRTGTSSEANDIGIPEVPGGFEWVSWSESVDVEVTLASRSLPAEDLAALAESAEVDGTTVRLPDLPAGLTEQGVLEGMPFGGASYVPGAADGWYDTYYRPISPTPGVTLENPMAQVATFHDPDGRAAAAIRWMVDARFAPLPVRDGDAWVAETSTVDDQRTVTVVWEEAPGVIAVVQAAEIGIDEVLDLVEGLAPAAG